MKYLDGADSFAYAAELALDLPGYFGEGACIGANPRLFDGESLNDVLCAKKICASCPIREMCLDWALLTQSAGVWGGLTPSERIKVRKAGKPIDIDEVRMLEANRAKLLSRTPAARLAAEFEVTERTIYRWRKKIQAIGQAS